MMILMPKKSRLTVDNTNIMLSSSILPVRVTCSSFHIQQYLIKSISAECPDVVFNLIMMEPMRC